MIHPSLATMLAVVTTDYPLEPGEAIDVPAAGGRRELQLDLGRRRVLDERRRRACSRTARAASSDAGDRRGVRRARSARSAPSSPQQIVADGEGATVAARDRGHRRGRRRRGARRSPAGSRPRRSSRPPPSAATRTGAACSPPPARRRATAGSRSSTPTGVTLSFNGTTVFARGAPTGVEPALDGPSAGSSSTSASATARAALPRLRPLLRLRPHQRGVPT